MVPSVASRVLALLLVTRTILATCARRRVLDWAPSSPAAPLLGCCKPQEARGHYSQRPEAPPGGCGGMPLSPPRRRLRRPPLSVTACALPCSLDASGLTRGTCACEGAQVGNVAAALLLLRALCCCPSSLACRRVGKGWGGGGGVHAAALMLIPLPTPNPAQGCCQSSPPHTTQSLHRPPCGWAATAGGKRRASRAQCGQAGSHGAQAAWQRGQG